jgi:hypothetical protein
MRSAAIWSRNLQQRLETTRQRAALDELEDERARDRQLLEVAARRRTIRESRRGVPTDREKPPGWRVATDTEIEDTHHVIGIGEFQLISELATIWTCDRSRVRRRSQ